MSADSPLWVIQDLALLTPPSWVPCCCRYLSLLGFSWSALHQQGDSTQGSQLCHAWREKWSREGWSYQRTEIPEKQRETYSWTVAQWLMQSNCHELFWRTLTFVTFTVSFPHPSSFLFLFSLFLHLAGDQRDKAMSWLRHCLDHRCHSDAAKGAGWLERWICTDVPAAKAGLGESSSLTQVYSCDLRWLQCRHMVCFTRGQKQQLFITQS